MTDRGYGRISLDTLTSGSIAKQKARVEAFAGSDFIWYRDESVSGSKVRFKDRPDGARLLEDLLPGDRVLVTKIDRAARSVRDLLDLVEIIEQRGASIVFIDQNIDTAGPMGRFLLTLLGAIAELEAGIIAERRRESLESFAREGRHAVGKAPWGFVSVPNPDGRGLVIRVDPDLRDKAREVVARILAGEPQSSVRQDIGMSKTGMHKWLHNPRLAGMTPDGEGVVTIDGVPRIDPDAALLSIEEWQELQGVFSARPPKTWVTRETYAEALTCSVCGARMYVNVSKEEGRDTYVCRKNLHDPGQQAPSIMTHRADAYLEERFLSEVGHRQALIETWSDSLEPKLQAVAVAGIRLEEAQRRFTAALSDEEESEALGYLRDAKAALRAAQSLQGERISTVTDTGQTVAQVWEGASTPERCRLLTRLGKWTLDFGRGKNPEERISLEKNDVLFELLTHTVGSEGEEYEDRGGFLLPQK